MHSASLGVAHIAVVAVLMGLAGASIAANCDLCHDELAELQKQDAEREKTAQLLGKNQSYLAALTANEASKTLKVQSNIIVILQKLDAIRGKSDRSREKMKALECEQCAPGEEKKSL